MPREDLGPVLAVSMGALRKASPKNPGEAFKTARMWIPYHGFLSITNAGIPLWERKVAGYVCVHREGERKCIGCAALISLPSDPLPRHQAPRRLTAWEASNNYTPKADAKLPK